ncbi:major facilitator superfamily domain-containing protein [Endogone sp. FLAS-F59071]|nr:major facilitator superfamily domain-containing protein [Endogone sp. FLAS-F59071]|eukprot:RUS13315.1 major facilitator superfamily domain-containing protein [Endogone sp. FLAS-F59071]
MCLDSTSAVTFTELQDVEIGDKDSISKPAPATQSSVPDDSNTQTSLEHSFVQEEQPDGGLRGWLVVLASFTINFIVFGCGTTCEVFGPRGIPSAQLSLVGSITFFVILSMGTFVGAPAVARFGLRPVLATGGVIAATGLVLAGQSTQVWHLYLTQGILFGLGSSMLYIPIQSIPAQWFSKRRATALGFAASGTGIGGLVISPLVSKLISTVGVTWCYRIIAIIFFVLAMVATMCAKPRIVVKRSARIINLSLLKNPAYIIWLLLALCAWGYLEPFIYLPIYASSLQISPSMSANLLSIISGLNALGRILIGVAGDRFGRIRVLLFTMFISGASCMIIWTLARNLAELIVFSIIFGFFCGAFFTMVVPITAEIVGMENLSAATSLAFTVASVGVFATSIVDAIQGAVAPGTYLVVILSTGGVYIVGTVLLVILLIVLQRQKKGKA